MKTPSSLLLLPFLLAAQTASAAIEAGDRCDKAFLANVVKEYGANAIINDAVRIGTQKRDGHDMPSLNFAKTETCDAATWRLLGSGDPVVFRNTAVGSLWNGSLPGGQAGILLVATDFFKDIDAKSLAVLQEADDAISAGVALGVAKQKDATAAQDAWLTANAGGALKSRKIQVVVAEAGEATVTKQSVGLQYRKLVPVSGKGPGGAVLRFRVAVMALAAELGRQSKTNAYVITRLTPPPAPGAKSRPAPPAGIKDHLGVLPANFAPAEADMTVAADDAKWKDILASVVGDGAPALDAADSRPKGALDSVDVAMRNIIAVRNAELEAISKAAAAKLAETKKTIPELEAIGRADATAAKDKPNNALAADVLRRMTETPEYLRLDALFENKKDAPGWLDSAEGKQVKEARDRLQAAALSARVEGPDGQKKIVYTQGGKTYSIDGFEPAKVESDANTRNDVAGMLARMIVGQEQGDPKFAALVAAVGGQGQPGQPLNTNLTMDEDPLAAQIRAQTNVSAPAKGQSCETPADIFRNKYERYAARTNSAGADLAERNIKDREGLRKEKERLTAAAKVECDRRKAEAAAYKGDYFDPATDVNAERAKRTAAAESWCTEETARIERVSMQALKDIQAAEQGGARDTKVFYASADETLKKDFSLAILASLDTLRKEYTQKGNKRLNGLVELTGDSPNLIGKVTKYFETEWPQTEQGKAALATKVDACATALGLGSVQASSRSYRSPDNPNNVDEYCKVNEGLTNYIKELGRPAAPAPAK